MASMEELFDVVPILEKSSQWLGLCEKSCKRDQEQFYGRLEKENKPDVKFS